MGIKSLALMAISCLCFFITETECNYVQMEKELQAIVFGVEKFESYLYGRKFKVETDHRPLESIIKNSLLSAPKRLQRFAKL